MPRPSLLHATLVALAACGSPAPPATAKPVGSPAAALQALLAGKEVVFVQPSAEGAFCSVWRIERGDRRSGRLVRETNACGHRTTFSLRYALGAEALELTAESRALEGQVTRAASAAPDRLKPIRRLPRGVETDRGALYPSDRACTEDRFIATLPPGERLKGEEVGRPLELSVTAMLAGSEDFMGGVPRASDDVGSALLEVLDSSEAWFVVRDGTGTRCDAWSIEGSRHHPDRQLTGATSFHVIPIFACGGLWVDGATCKEVQVPVDAFERDAFHAGGSWWFSTRAACDAARARGEPGGSGPGCSAR